MQRAQLQVPGVQGARCYRRMLSKIAQVDDFRACQQCLMPTT